MKCQISLEFLLYTSLSILALSSSLGLFTRVLPNFSGFLSIAQTNIFIDQLTLAMLNQSSSVFQVFVPPGLCNSTFHGDLLSVKSQNFELPVDISASNSIFCPDDSYRNFSIQRQFGTILLK